MNGFTPQRQYKMVNDLNALQMLSIAVPLFGMFVLLGSDKVASMMMIPSIVLLVTFVTLSLFPSSTNYGTRMIVSIYYAWRYMLTKLYERSLKKIENLG